jgi:membrane protein implicated in regulation of membrane protease activity
MSAGGISSAMTTTTRPPAVAALLGLLTLFVVGFGATALLEPYVWPSLLVGIPIGVVSGVLVTVASYWLLTRSHRRAAAQQDD